MMGRPRRLNGQRSRAISLDAETSDAADRMPNFSRFVREAVREHMNGSEKVVLDQVATRRLAAIILHRVQRMEYEAEGDDDPEAPTEELKAVAAAIREWLSPA